MSLHSVFSACLLPLNSTSQPAWAADCLSLAEYALRTHPAPSSLFLGTRCLCCRFVFDDVSKVTLPAWPGQGMDAIAYLQDS